MIPTFVIISNQQYLYWDHLEGGRERRLGKKRPPHNGGIGGSVEEVDEALMTNPKFGPNCRQNELGQRSCH